MGTQGPPAGGQLEEGRNPRVRFLLRWGAAGVKGASHRTRPGSGMPHPSPDRLEPESAPDDRQHTWWVRRCDSRAI